MILAAAAVFHYAGEAGVEGAEDASRAVYDAVIEDGRRRHPHP